MEASREPHPVMSFKDAEAILKNSVRLEPRIFQEITRLSGGNFGVQHSIITEVTEAITYDRFAANTAQDIRRIVGAPDREEDMAAWRTAINDRHREEQN